LAETKLDKSRKGPKRGENIFFMGREWYYVVSMYKLYQLTLFLVFIDKLTRSQTFSPDCLELGIISVE